LIENGSPSAVFACAFLCLTWNLMCRVDSTDGVCIKHLVWSQDAVGNRFSHTKNDQDGSKNFCFPEILQDRDGLLFPGAEQED